MRLIIDLSPSAINRTAMYQISLDIADTLRDETVAFQYFGKTFKERPSSKELENAKTGFGKLIGLAEQGDMQAAKSFHRSLGSGTPRSVPTLYLDPLYVLFGPLTANDAVLLLDLSTISNPEWHGAAVGRLYDVAFARIARERPRLLAISQNTSDTYAANFGYPTQPIKVVHLYVPEHLRVAAERTSKLYSPNPYFLFVGSLESRKNVVGAIEAFRMSDLGSSGYKLLIAGGQGHGSDTIQRLVNATPHVHLCGFVDNEELHALYAGATGFLYPSYLEGFGVPLLEALLYGIPSIASVTGACPEVGGDMVRYVDPDDHATIAEELLRITRLSHADRSLIGERCRSWVNSHFRYSDFQNNIRRAVLTDD